MKAEGKSTHIGVFTFEFMGVLLSCKVERERRPKSSEAKLLGGGTMESQILPSLVS